MRSRIETEAVPAPQPPAIKFPFLFKDPSNGITYLRRANDADRAYSNAGNADYVLVDPVQPPLVCKPSQRVHNAAPDSWAWAHRLPPEARVILQND